MVCVPALYTDDGVRIDTAHTAALSGQRHVAVVLVHGFSLSKQHRRLRRIITTLCHYVGVVALDLRGHGRSGGRTTVGWQEVRDVDAAVRWARSLGYLRVVTLGFSLGAAVVLRHAAERGGTDAVVAVSGPGLWFFRGTSKMRSFHRYVETAPGRGLLRVVRGTRVNSTPWPEPAPMDPREAAAAVEVPLLIIHGGRDDYFPVEHAQGLVRASQHRAELWVEDDVGHAEAAMRPELIARIGHWITQVRV